MKRVGILAILLLATSAGTRADNIVQVLLNPATPAYPMAAPSAAPSTMYLGAVFDWDVTTGIVTNGVGFAGGGPYFQNMTPLGNTFNGSFLDFTNPGGDFFQLSYGNHAFLIPSLTGATGTFGTDLWALCAECIGDHNQQQFFQGTATVTAFVDPVSTPESSTLTLTLVALAAIFAFY